MKPPTNRKKVQTLLSAYERTRWHKRQLKPDPATSELSGFATKPGPSKNQQFRQTAVPKAVLDFIQARSPATACCWR